MSITVTFDVHVAKLPFTSVTVMITGTGRIVTSEQLKVGLHSLGYVANTTQEAIDDFYPGYAETFTRIGKERGWPPVTRQHFDAQNSPKGALLIGGPEEIAAKILRHSEALGGISRFTFQMDNAALPHHKLLQSIELIGSKVMPLVNKND